MIHALEGRILIDYSELMSSLPEAFQTTHKLMVLQKDVYYPMDAVNTEYISKSFFHTNKEHYVLIKMSLLS